MRFFSKAVIFFPSDMVSERSIVIYLAHKGGHFSPKSWNISRMLPKHMCDRPPRISYFAHKFSLTRFFPKKGVNFNFLRQNKYDKAPPISFTKDIILLIHIKKVRRLCYKAPKKHHTLPADVLPNASEALFVTSLPPSLPHLTSPHHKSIIFYLRVFPSNILYLHQIVVYQRSITIYLEWHFRLKICVIFIPILSMTGRS